MLLKAFIFVRGSEVICLSPGEKRREHTKGVCLEHYILKILTIPVNRLYEKISPGGDCDS